MLKGVTQLGSFCPSMETSAPAGVVLMVNSPGTTAGAADLPRKLRFLPALVALEALGLTEKSGGLSVASSVGAASAAAGAAVDGGSCASCTGTAGIEADGGIEAGATCGAVTGARGFGAGAWAAGTGYPSSSLLPE